MFLRATIVFAICLLGPATASASYINYSSREINFKVVYYGSASACLSETLQYVYDELPLNSKGKMIEIATGKDRVKFFDFLPPKLGEIRGFGLRFHLYATPSGTELGASQKLILRGVDGVVFVASSDPRKKQETLSAYRALKASLKTLDYSPQTIPMTIQLDACAGSRKQLNPQQLRVLLGLQKDHEVLETHAIKGTGVFVGLKSIAKKVILQLKESANKEDELSSTQAERIPTLPSSKKP